MKFSKIHIRFIIMGTLLAALLLLTGCGETKTVTCDGCGKAVEIKADSNMDDSWIVFCGECETDLFGEDGLIPKD